MTVPWKLIAYILLSVSISLASPSQCRRVLEHRHAISTERYMTCGGKLLPPDAAGGNDSAFPWSMDGSPKKIQLSRFNYADTDLMGGQINYSTDVLWSVLHPTRDDGTMWCPAGSVLFDVNVNLNSGSNWNLISFD